MKSQSVRIITAVLIVFVCVGVGVAAQPAQAVTGSDWRAGRIIDDGIFYNKNAMNVDQIQQFLNAKVPVCDTQGSQPHAGTTRKAYSASNGVSTPFICLKDYQENPTTHQNNLGGSVPSGAISAAQIIWNAAQQYTINPQVLIVMLQKEQALVQDDWPWPVQYRSAMGYGCPDTAACDNQYYGFYNQVMNAARQFRLYANNPNNYNFVPGNGNNIQYNPNGGCGSGPVTIEDQSTASLYNYTPYQPNQAALNNLYGNGDGCSAYGNRNFWRMFNDWFGPTRAGEAMIIKAENSPTQYVMINNTRYAIPSLDIKSAWNLDRFPLITMSDSYVNSLPHGDELSRVVRAEGEPMWFFVDGGRKYYIPSQQTLAAWNYSGADLRQLPWSIMNMAPDGPWLNNMVHEPNNGPGVYLIDGTKRYHITSGDMITAWQGNGDAPISVSQGLYDQYTSSGDIDTFKVQNGGGQKYIVNSGYKLPVDTTAASAFPGSFVTLSDATLNRLQVGAVPSSFIIVPNTPAVYLLDNGSKRWITSPAIMDAWGGAHPTITYLTQGHLNKMNSGANITTVLASNSNGSAYYFMNGSKRPIPTGLRQAYSGGVTPPTYSDQLLGNISTGSNATPYIQVSGQPSIYMLDAGKYRNLPSWEDFTLWGGTYDQVTQISNTVLSNFSNGGTAKAYVTDGTNKYMFASPGTYYSVDSTVISNWNLSSPSTVTSDALSRATNANVSLPGIFKIGGKTYLMRQGVGYGSDNADLLSVWRLSSSTTLDANTRRYFADKPLTRYVASPQKGDNKIYYVSEDTFLHIGSPVQVYNLGYQNEGIVNLPAADIDALGTSEWNNIVVKDGSNNYYVIDSGKKRKIVSPAVSQWTNSSALSTQTVSAAFLNMLPSSGDIAKSFRSPDSPKIYAGVNGQKRWVTSQSVFATQYGPEIVVSTDMTQSLVDGPDITQ